MAWSGNSVAVIDATDAVATIHPGNSVAFVHPVGSSHLGGSKRDRKQRTIQSEKQGKYPFFHGVSEFGSRNAGKGK